MLNDRDEKKMPGQDESEYHFSDDDVSYEVEAETEAPPTVSETKASKFAVLKRLIETSNSRRLIISAVVFLVLVFVVYKMVAPSDTTTAPAGNIVPEATPTLAQQHPQVALPQHPTQAPAMTTQAAQTIAPQQAQATVPQQQAQMLPQQMPPQQTMMPQAQMPQQQMPQQQAMVPQTQMPQAAPPAQVQMQPPQMQPSVTQTVTTVPTHPQVVVTTSTGGNPAQQAYALQQQVPQQVAPAAYYPTQQVNPILNAQVPGGVQNGVAQLSAQAEQLSSQVNGQAVQRMNEFAQQNKNLQDQVQTLNTRVATMEGQLNQLVQLLTRQAQAAPTPAPAPAPAAEAPVSRMRTEVHTEVAPVGPAPHIPYSVQAIIPGRAWLRAPNGETLTVAEGDMIKSVGRVTKIDPYDGIVEINTGSRVVSLSYGNSS
jgi:intracellular multiplication protein IcmG